ncbi:MAG: TerC family protein [Elusimicrobiales bacterium]|nr:TerC family protein [Elusimicrobiales bacterium]
MSNEAILWTVFNLAVAGLLYFDLKVVSRHAHVVSFREAALWSVVWIGLALLFNLGIYHFMGEQKALEFLTAYVIEKSLSVDNLFVFIMIFTHFGIEAKYQPRILHWGILGALVMRFVLILAGVQLINAFHWIIYVFGAFLIYTGVRMGLAGDQKIDPGRNPILVFFRKFLPFTKEIQGQEFFVKSGGVWRATPLFAALIVVEASDLVFAVDSIPAVLAISTDTFIVYTSNVFAILGLRALYFLLAGVMGMFRYLKTGLSVVLCYVGFKMLLMGVYKIHTGVSLGIVLGILAVSVLASVLIKEKKKEEAFGDGERAAGGGGRN